MLHTRINNDTQAKKLVKYLLTCPTLAFDSETDGLEWITGTMFFNQWSDGNVAWIVDIRRVNIQLFKPVFESPHILKIIHNSAFDCSWLAREFEIFTRNIYDTRYQEQNILGIALGRGLKKAIKEVYEPLYSASLKWCFYRRNWEHKDKFEPYFPLPWEPDETQVDYMVHDVDMLHDLMRDQQQTLAQMGLENVSVLENEISRITYMMMYNGFGVDVASWLKFTKTQDKEYKQLMTALGEIAPGLNWQSPKQYCNFFGVGRTADLDQLDENDFDPFQYEGSELPDYINPDRWTALQHFRRARAIYKNVKTYGKTFIEKYVVDNRIRCQYTQMVNTARFSSDNPNMQNLPAESPHTSFLTSRHRGWKLVRADFSGQEMAIMAVGSGEIRWLECLRAGGDLHALVASDILEQWKTWSPAERKVQRRIVKIINFSIAYGAGVSTIALRAGVSVDVIEPRLRAMKIMYPRLFAWLRTNAEKSKLTWETYSMPPFNRYRSLAMEPEGWRRKNIGMNNPVQATAADMTKLSMYYYQLEIDNGLEAELMHMQHDELITGCPAASAEHNGKILVACMNRACIDILGEPLSQPELTISDNWDKRKAA